MTATSLERVAPRPLRWSSNRLQLLKTLRQTRLVDTGLVILAVVSLCAILAGVISPYDPLKQDYLAIAQPPSAAHWLGTDDLGRDVLSRIIYGSRVSLQVGAISVAFAVTVGALLGLVAGYVGGIVDDVIMRFVDAVQAFPGLILALGLTAALGPSIRNVMIAIGFISSPTIARLTRAQTLSVRETEYIAAARVSGAKPTTIVARHIWPNVIAPIIVQATLLVATAIVTEASLSFLGVGVQPPTPSWGSMLRTGSQYLEVAPWLAFAPGVAIFLTVLAFNFIGDGLRRALDPKLASRQQA
jgi:peptide/nickel transport system permease protein